MKRAIAIDLNANEQKRTRRVVLRTQEAVRNFMMSTKDTETIHSENRGTGEVEHNVNAMEAELSSNLRNKLMNIMLTQMNIIREELQTKFNEVTTKLEDAIDKLNTTNLSAGKSNEAREHDRDTNEGENDVRNNQEKDMGDDEEKQEKRRSTVYELPKFAFMGTKLTQGSEFELWRDIIEGEIKAKDCAWTISDEPIPKEFTDHEVMVRRDAVRNFIVRHLDEYHHRIVKQYTRPCEVMKTLITMCQPSGKLTSYALRKQFNDMKFDANAETVVDFLARFNDLVAKIRRCEKLEDEDVRRNLIIAIEEACPGIHMKEMASEGNLSLADIQSLMREEELRTKEQNRRRDDTSLLTKQGNAMLTKQTKSEESGKITCFKCGVNGHNQYRCPNDGRWCYNCRQFVKDHISKTCPQRRREDRYTTRGATVSGGFAKWNNDRYQTKTRSGGLQQRRLKLITTRRARHLSKQLTNRGFAHLVTYEDEATKHLANEEERMVWVDEQAIQEAMQNNEGDTDYADYANQYDDEDDSSQRDDKYDEGAAAYFNSDGKISGINNISFIVDTGATQHLVNRKNAFVSLRQNTKTKRIACANRNSDADLLITHEGDIVIKCNGKIGTLRNVMFAPNLSENLFALRKMMNCATANFEQDKMTLIDKKTHEVIETALFDGKFWHLNFELPLSKLGTEERKSILRIVYNNEKGGSRKRGVFHLDDDIAIEGSEPKRQRKCETQATMTRDDLDKLNQQRVRSLKECEGILWHLRLNHASKTYLEAAAKFIPEMRGVKFTHEISECESCKLAKAKRKPCNTSRTRATKPLERIHSDLVGAITPCSFSTGAKYIVTFTDDFSRFAMAFSIENKTEIHLAMSKYLKEMRLLLGNSDYKIVSMRTDGGTEYLNPQMRQLMRRENIELTPCNPYTPKHNGCAERINLEIEEKIRANLVSAKMPTSFWGYALRHVMYVHNRTPNKSVDFKTPFEMLLNRQPTVRYLRRFGCAAYYLDPKAKVNSKFAPRGKLGFLIECNASGYTLLDAKSKTTRRTKNVDFIESRVYGDYIKSKVALNELCFGEDGEACDEAPPQDGETKTPNQSNKNPKNAMDSDTDSSTQGEGDELGKFLGRDDEFEYYQKEEDVLTEDPLNLACFVNGATIGEDPASFEEAKRCSDWKLWAKAIDEELLSHKRCGTWVVIPRRKVPKSQKIINARWIFKKKEDANGVSKCKARLVARGFADNNLYDRNEVYAPVARLSDVRFILIATNKYDLELFQLDVKTAFLNGSLEKPVYMQIPEGVRCSEDVRRNSVCELRQSLYGLKVSPKRWFVRFNEAMKRLRFNGYPHQPCLFSWRSKNLFAILLLYVDDILVASNSSDKMQEIKSHLSQEFEMTDLGEPAKFLGIEIRRDRKNKTIAINQKNFIEVLLRKFDVYDVNAVSTPMVAYNSSQAITENSDAKEIADVPYRQAIGSLIYLQNGTRPDITYSVNVLSRKQSNYTYHNWTQIKCIFRYLKGTKELYIVYRGKEECLACYPDASLGFNDPDGESTSGYAMFMFGDLLSWRTKKQSHIALSSAEAEYIAMSLACKELASTREMMRCLLQVRVTPIIYEDNRAAIELAVTDESRTLKHIVKLCYHYV